LEGRVDIFDHIDTQSQQHFTSSDFICESINSRSKLHQSRKQKHTPFFNHHASVAKSRFFLQIYPSKTDMSHQKSPLKMQGSKEIRGISPPIVDPTTWWTPGPSPAAAKLSCKPVDTQTGGDLNGLTGGEN